MPPCFVPVEIQYNILIIFFMYHWSGLIIKQETNRDKITTLLLIYYCSLQASCLSATETHKKNK